MAATNPTWQDILNSLTVKAKKDGRIRSLKNAKTIEAKVDKVIDSISIRYTCTQVGVIVAWSLFEKRGFFSLYIFFNLNFKNITLTNC